MVRGKSRVLSSACISLSALSYTSCSASHIAFTIAPLHPITNHIHRTLMTLADTRTTGCAWQDVLPYDTGSHRAAKITVPPQSLQTDNNEHSLCCFEKENFKKRLETTIAACKQLNLSSLWITVPMSRGSLLEDMMDLGLQFHHAEGDTCNLVVWLEQGESKIPTFATHQIGVGAMVVNSRQEILCVRELRNNYMPWKIPGGLSELGEPLDVAAEREVMEETGVPCRFKSIVCFRHTHGLQFGRSDVYFVCRMEPIIEHVGTDGQEIFSKPIPQAGEIAEAAWVPLQEYREMVFGENGGYGHPMMKHVMRIYDQGQDIQKTMVNSIVPGRKANPIYHPQFNVENEAII